MGLAFVFLLEVLVRIVGMAERGVVVFVLVT
jgi:hypothetical protein